MIVSSLAIRVARMDLLYEITLATMFVVLFSVAVVCFRVGLHPLAGIVSLACAFVALGLLAGRLPDDDDDGNER